jgi:glyoxylate/hydroxypyruvate reductase
MLGVVIPHMGSADVDTRKKMAELCKLNLAEPQKQLTSGVRNGINGAKGEALLAEVKP